MNQIEINETVLELVEGDITQQDVDALVNAANRGLAGGGGVDGAIHRAGGPTIMEECRQLRGCPTGQAKVTGGGDLKAKFVIHAVGPIYGGGREDAELLASAYRNSLLRAVENNCQSVAFPSLSTGAYGYPLTLAASVALGTVIEFIQSESHQLKLVRFCLFGQSALVAYQNALQRLENSEKSP